MKILLTGHKGFIGSCLLEKLETLNHDVLVVEAECGGLPSYQMLDSLLKQSDLVFHVGAISDTSLQDSNKMMKYNYLFSKDLFDAAQKYKKKIIYSSSAACSGNGDDIPNNIYGWSKLLAENYGMAKCSEFVSLRYFNVYGPGEEEKGRMASVAYQAWEMAMEKAAINRKIRLREKVDSSLKKDHFFKLFPNKPRRDFIYIDDVVEANLCAMSSEKGIYEVGYGEARTFESLLEGMGLEYRYHKSDRIPSWYQHHTCADKDKRLLGWTPKFNVESGTKEYRDHLALASVAQR